MMRDKVLRRYILFQVPGFLLLAAVLILLHRWARLPEWAVWALLALSIAKDAILYPRLRHSYDTHPKGPAHSMTDMPGTVVERLAPSGRVQVRGELWWAELDDSKLSAEPGETVRVIDMRGLTLIVNKD